LALAAIGSVFVFLRSGGWRRSKGSCEGARRKEVRFNEPSGAPSGAAKKAEKIDARKRKAEAKAKKMKEKAKKAALRRAARI